MFPFRDHNPSVRIPYVTYTLIAINVLVFLTHMGLSEAKLAEFYAQYALVPAWVVQGYQLQSFFTSMFLHGGFMHIFGNMLFLWIFGDNIEDQLGHIPYLFFYLVSGLIATSFHVVSNLDSNVPLIGASGAIAGVMGGYWLMFPKARVDVFFFFVIYARTFAIPSFWVLSIWLILQVFSGFSTAAGGDGVAYWAHFGGFLAGAGIMVPLWLKKGAKTYWTENDYCPPNPPTATISYRIPKITRRNPDQ